MMMDKKNVKPVAYFVVNVQIKMIILALLVEIAIIKLWITIILEFAFVKRNTYLLVKIIARLVL